jgi:hypothetical protein
MPAAQPLINALSQKDPPLATGYRHYSGSGIVIFGISPLPIQAQAKNFVPNCHHEPALEVAEKFVAMEETADSSGLNFTPTSATTALVGDPGSPLGMTKIEGLQWRT